MSCDTSAAGYEAVTILHYTGTNKGSRPRRPLEYKWTQLIQCSFDGTEMTQEDPCPRRLPSNGRAVHWMKAASGIFTFLLSALTSGTLLKSWLRGIVINSVRNVFSHHCCFLSPAVDCSHVALVVFLQVSELSVSKGSAPSKHEQVNGILFCPDTCFINSIIITSF